MQKRTMQKLTHPESVALRAVADLFERDAQELGKSPLPFNQYFCRKLKREAKQMRGEASAMVNP
jgi:hypothetical protein